VEYGAGSGTLAVAILAGLREDGSPLADALAYAPIELNRHRLAELRGSAAAVGLPVVDAAGLDDVPAAGVVLASEFLDALPVHVVEMHDGRPREVHVGIGCDGAFEDVLGELSEAAVAERLAALDAAGVVLAEGQRLEVRPAVETWAHEAARRLAAGLVLVLDYGAPAADLYGPRRRAGTLMTYRGHVAEGDPGAPYRDIGGRDMTAHVDMTALGAALTGAGLDLLGETSQAELLVGCGLEELVQRRQEALATASEALELRSAVMRLLDPRHLGGFRAVLAGRGLAADPPLRGLAYRGPGHR
jgi:SAM-dependent MidA family methyltransferase